jgi:hypothetical protein
MNNFKVLVGTDTFHKEGSPHLVATLIECDSVSDREDKYNDVVGFYREIPDAENIDNAAIKEMDDWADILKKNIIFLVKSDKKLGGWLFEYSKDISYREIQAFTLNDVNYDIWLDPETNFWNPVDFLLEAEYYTPDVNHEDGIFDKLKNIEESITQINTKISDLTDNMREMVEKIK